MARKPKKIPPGRHGGRTSPNTAEPQWQHENQSAQTADRVRWFSAHEYTTSEDTLRTPKAEEKPGIGAPTARQEPDATFPKTDTVTQRRQRTGSSTSTHERPSRPRRRSSTRARRHAAPRNRRARSAH